MIPSTTILISMKIYQLIREVLIKNIAALLKMIFMSQKFSTIRKTGTMRIPIRISLPSGIISIPLKKGVRSKTSSSTGTKCPRKFTDTQSIVFPGTITTSSTMDVPKVFTNATTNQLGRTASVNSHVRSKTW